MHQFAFARGITVAICCLNVPVSFAPLTVAPQRFLDFVDDDALQPTQAPAHGSSAHKHLICSAPRRYLISQVTRSRPECRTSGTTRACGTPRQKRNSNTQTRSRSTPQIEANLISFPLIPPTLPLLLSFNHGQPGECLTQRPSRALILLSRCTPSTRSTLAITGNPGFNGCPFKPSPWAAASRSPTSIPCFVLPDPPITS